MSDDVTTVGKEFPLILHVVAQGDTSTIWYREIKFHTREFDGEDIRLPYIQ